MNLVRGIGRILLGGFYISNGWRTLRHPGEIADATEPVSSRVAPLAQRVLPDSVAGFVPEDPTTVARLSGAASLMGGIGMVLGIGTRPAGCLAAGSMIPQLLATSPLGSEADSRAANRAVFARNLALFGAALVVSQDTRGKPGVVWRAKDTKVRLAREADRARRTIAHEADHAGALVGKDLRRAQRAAKRQARAARKSIEGGALA